MSNNEIEDEYYGTKQIAKLEGEGHTYHCAARLVWGDGECECELKGKPPGPISQMILKADCEHENIIQIPGGDVCEDCGEYL